MNLIQLLTWLFAVTTVFGASTLAVWTNNPLIKTGIVTLVSSSTVKTGLYAVSFPSSFVSTPKFVYGTSQVQGPETDILEWTTFRNTLSTSAFQVSFTIGSSTIISFLSIYYLAIDQSFTLLGTYSDGNFTSTSANMGMINQGTGYRQTYRTVNFTSVTGEVLIMSHRTVILAFINSVIAKRNGGDFNVTVLSTIDNPNNYTIYVGTSGTCTIHGLTYSRLTFDQTALQSAQLTYIDSGVVGGASTSWASLVLTFP